MHVTVSTSRDGSVMRLRVEALLPTATAQLTQIYPLAVLPSPLSEAMRSPGRHAIGTGYLTMEQTRKLVLLGERDPKAFEVPSP